MPSLERRPTHEQIVLEVLDDGGWHSTHDILAYAFEHYQTGMIVHSRIASLRKQLRQRGEDIVHEKEPGIGGAHGHGYRIVSPDGLPGAGEVAGRSSLQQPLAASPAPPVDEALAPAGREQLRLEAT